VSDKDMGYEWEELCDSQDFNHGDRFVELDDYLLIKSQLNEANKVAVFYGKKNNWQDNDYYRTTIHNSDWRSSGPINAIGGKRARSYCREYNIRLD